MGQEYRVLPDRSRTLLAHDLLASMLMTVPEMLAALGGSVSRDTFYKWRQTGKGPRCFPLPNGELRCRRDDFQQWLDDLYGRAAA
jgi:predicted DNA-binding transcriptional regulator AlpA